MVHQYLVMINHFREGTSVFMVRRCTSRYIGVHFRVDGEEWVSWRRGVCERVKSGWRGLAGWAVRTGYVGGKDWVSGRGGLDGWAAPYRSLPRFWATSPSDLINTVFDVWRESIRGTLGRASEEEILPFLKHESHMEIRSDGRGVSSSRKLSIYILNTKGGGPVASSVKHFYCHHVP